MFAGHAYSLSAITLPSTVTKISDYAFWYSGLETINFNGTKAQWQNISFYTTQPYCWNEECHEIKVVCSDGEIIIPEHDCI